MNSPLLARIITGRPFYQISSIFSQRIQPITESVKKKLDYSKVPVLKEEELEEQFVHGSGPGGQAVNKAHNCVLLKHKPTGLQVKVHESREGHKNRIIARQRLLDQLDDYINGTESISAQVKRIKDAKQKSQQSRAAKLRDLKKAFKEANSQRDVEETSNQTTL